MTFSFVAMHVQKKKKEDKTDFDYIHSQNKFLVSIHVMRC